MALTYQWLYDTVRQRFASNAKTTLEAFAGFAPAAMVSLHRTDIARHMQNSRIIRHRAKLRTMLKNALQQDSGRSLCPLSRPSSRSASTRSSDDKPEPGFAPFVFL